MYQNNEIELLRQVKVIPPYSQLLLVPVMSVWYDPRSRSISNSSQCSLEESNEVLTITNTDEQGNGV